MLMDRVRYFSLLLGIIVIFTYYKSVDYATIAVLTPFLKSIEINLLNYNINLITVISLFLFIGAVSVSQHN